MSAEVNTDRVCDEELLFSSERSLKEAHDEDLMLAAEIGKSLLERNRELEVVLKATQEFAEEQCAQVDFYLKQVEILRDGNEMSSRACEQLEANNRILSDKCEQWKGECKILEGKNARLWEVINNLETRIEELTSELEKVSEDLTEIKEKENETKEKEEVMIRTDMYTYNRTHEKELNYLNTIPAVVADLPSPCETENESLKKQLSELNIQNKLGKLEKGEIESQLEDLVSENQALYHKISNLNQEITEWEHFAQKEENYRRLAAAFTLKHYAEIEPDSFDAVEKTIQETLLPSTKLTKAKSCESLYLTTDNSIGVAKVVKSPTLVNNILSSVNSSSFLSELDTEYADLVKRYESLLEKFTKQGGQLNENPERTRKVQRAIQTLSMDFSMLTSPTKTTSAGTSPMKDSKTYILKSPGCDGDDYRKLFSDIFAKLKESRLSK